MQTPIYQQLAGLAAYAYSVLRDDRQLTGDDAGEYNYQPDEVCKSVYTHKLFEVQGDGIVQLFPVRQNKLPALAIYIERAEFTDVEGSSGGTTYPVGMDCRLGLQYIFKTRSKDVEAQEFAEHFAYTIWYVLCQRLAKEWVSASSVLRGAQINLTEFGMGACSLLPPFTEAVRAWEADAEMSFKRPPWMTAAASGLVTTLASIYGDLDETGESGASPLIQLKWSQ
jgi:hypothetical protein